MCTVPVYSFMREMAPPVVCDVFGHMCLAIVHACGVVCMYLYTYVRCVCVCLSLCVSVCLYVCEHARKSVCYMVMPTGDGYV